LKRRWLWLFLFSQPTNNPSSAASPIFGSGYAGLGQSADKFPRLTPRPISAAARPSPQHHHPRREKRQAHPDHPHAPYCRFLIASPLCAFASLRDTNPHLALSNF
jgi:hypothetical protein